jgi:hypothetical protein
MTEAEEVLKKFNKYEVLDGVSKRNKIINIMVENELEIKNESVR